MTKHISGEQARQGRRGARVLVILLASLLLAALAWIALEYYGQAIEPGPEESIPSTGVDG